MKQLLLALPVLMLLSTQAVAKDVSTLRYPWDLRPASCPMGDATEPKECALKHFSSRLEARQKIFLLYYTEQFHLLERALEDLSGRGAPAKGWTPLSTSVFFGLYDSMDRRSIPIERHEPRLKRWREANPDSLHLPVAEAILLGRRAWQARGAGYAYTVTSESWAVFEDLHAKAERVLLAAPPEARNRPGWHDALQWVSINLNNPKTPPLEVFEEAIRKYPLNHSFYTRAANRLMPKWGGSWQELEAFASKYTEATEANDGGGLYARIYASVGLDEPFKVMGIDWNKLKTSFEKLVALTDGDPYYRNRFASFACAARDEATFIKAFEAIKPHEIKPSDWLRGHSPDACKVWAFKNT